MATKFQKTVKQAIDDSTGAFADKIVCHKDGTISIKRGYFYTHGQTAIGWAEKVSKVLDEAGIAHYIDEASNAWKAWPADSYFIAVVSAR